MKYQPPYTITSIIIHLIAQIGENIGRLTVLEEIQDSLKLRKANRICTMILSRWNPIFANIPVESLIYQNQKSPL